ncbi:Hypothetical predicted protein [Cloeon dipterum]|nr:Hypothetical predicted protein [Cloeon dipterum]
MNSWSFVVLLIAASAAASDIQDCLHAKSPAACLQSTAYRHVRDLVAEETIVLSQGIELVRPVKPTGARKAEDVAAEAVLSQEKGDLEQRQEILQQYVADKVQEAASERRLSVQVDTVAGRMYDTVKALTNGQGRAIKKIIKSLLPVIVGFILKVATLVVISYIGMGLLAKKAAIGSLIAIAISIVTFIRSLIVSKHAKHHEQAQLLGALAGQVSA